MEKLNDNKAAIWTAIIVAVSTFILTSFFSNWNKIDDTLTKDEVQEMVDRKGEEILERSRRYTEDQVQSANTVYLSSIKHIEDLLKVQNDKFTAILESIDERLNRINERVP